MRGSVAFEFRTTVTGNLHEVEDFSAIGKWIRGAGRYFLQPFVQSDDILVPNGEYAVDSAMLAQALAAVREYVPNAAIRGR